ncbi:MAG: adenylate/guanylate cyclase domain-containing protein [Planctomycetes bacterium]|nr:adenylate/guanylate cyclase domain-containing protein [Planctomycetota bacterium]MCB9825661.1 adenylate/guanylate cyclase domain-containing protein [Planctomycetota bacterium]MCB9901299.1 adenylate/guanylate cyclase domain-containing protein [Planctomycetota bacterium]
MTQVPRLESTSTARRALSGVLLGLGVTLLLSLLRGSSGFERVEGSFLDARTRMFVGQRAPDPRIVLAVVDEIEVREMQERTGSGWPWTEDYLQLLPQALEGFGARGLLIDVVYLDRGQDDEEVATARREVAAAQRAQVAGYADALRSFGRAGAAVLLARTPTWTHPPRVAAATERFLPLEGAASPEGPFGPRGIDASVRAFTEGVRYVGFANTVSDVDGIVRRAAPVARAGDRAVASLPLVGAALVSGKPVRVTADSVEVDGARQGLDENGTFLLAFPAEARRIYPTVSPVEVLFASQLIGVPEAELSAEDAGLVSRVRTAVKDRLVVFGQNVHGHEDVLATPIEDNMLGPELLATTVDVLLHGDGRLPWSRLANALFLAFLATGTALLGTLPRGRLWNLAGVVLAAAVCVGLGVLLFAAGHAIDLFTPLVGIALAGIAAGTLRLLTEGARNRWLEGTFSRYLAPDVIEALKRDPDRIQLGGRRREITIFFSDVAGFTSISERLEPEKVVRLLNRYLTGQSAEVMAQGGVIDKFEGDAIMAFFGDPLDMEDHALRACTSAVACVKALDALRPTLSEFGLERFDIRIGLNTGSAVVGNLGSDRRFDYTCMGDAVNLASRLEGANKHFGSRILIGPATREQAGDAILVKPLGDLVVVGKKNAISVYELIALADEATEAEHAHVAAFADAVQALEVGAWAEARDALGRAQDARPGDGPTAWLKGVATICELEPDIHVWDRRVVLHSK